MRHKQLVNGIRVYSRHAADCGHRKDATYVKCDCAKWFQFQNKQGKQVRVSAKTRTFSRACDAAKKLSEESESGVQQISVTNAVQDWLASRQQDGLNNEKAKLMSGRLEKFCKENNVTLLSDIKTMHLTALRATLPYKTTTSCSLKIHWSVLGGFFTWSVEAGYLAGNPMPKFKTKFEKPPVVPPTTAEVNRVLAIDETQIFASLMRYSGMAIQDTATLRRSALTDRNLITGNRAKTHESFRVRIPVWLADALRALRCNDAEYFFWRRAQDGRKLKVTSIVHHYAEQLRQSFATAGVTMSSHYFRHYFISEMLATGTSPEDVAKMVGTSAREIQKTYEHQIKAATDRLDSVQQKAWLATGLDQDGNPQKDVIQ